MHQDIYVDLPKGFKSLNRPNLSFHDLYFHVLKISRFLPDPDLSLELLVLE